MYPSMSRKHFIYIEYTESHISKDNRRHKMLRLLFHQQLSARRTTEIGIARDPMSLSNVSNLRKSYINITGSNDTVTVEKII